MGLPNCPSTPGTATPPTPALPEQSPPQNEAAELEPAGSEPAATPIPSAEPAASPVPTSEPSPGAISWALPLVWLERSLHASSLLESLRHSLPLSVPRRDVGTSVTPVPTVATGTSVTPVPTVATGTSVTPVPTMATGTSVTPVPTMAIGTSVTPVPTMATGTSVTPVSTAAIGTVMTPRERHDRSTGTAAPARAKDSAAETDSLLWHCPREQLRSLPRAELEGRLESTLIIIEALSLQLRGWQESQRPLPAVGPAEQRDAHTQTDVTRPRGEEQIYHGLYVELRRKTQALQRQRGAEQDLARELARAAEAMDAWAGQGLLLRSLTEGALQSLRDDRGALAQEREQVRALVSRCAAALQDVPGKLQSCLRERDEAQQRADEALRAKEEASHQLEETSVALQEAVAQVEQLTVANSRLGADLGTLMKQLAGVQQERDTLQQENKDQKEEISWLVRERDALQRERGELSRELREAAECREFLDQENRMSRRQLMEVEAKLKSTLAELQECSLQHEELKESHQCLQDERAALLKELESTKAELLDLQLKREKVSWCLADIAESKLRLQELADCLRAALEEEDDDAPSRSRTWTPAPRTPARRTPYRAGDSFVGSVLKAVSRRDTDEAVGFGSVPRMKPTKDKIFSTPKRAEPEDGLMERVAELRAVVSDLSLLSTRIQELEQSEFKALQAEISDLQLKLEEVTAESQERTDAQAATIAKLNKALRGKLQNEKELQDVVKQQEEKMLQLIDKSGEVMRLKGEVSQLKRSLQRAETEAKVLWEEMRGQEPKVDAAHVQERVLLRQEVDKLRLLLLEKEDENLLLSDKYLEQVRGLELRLRHSQKLLRTHEEMQEKVKEVLSSLPEVPPGCQELPGLLRYLGLKPSGGSKEATEPL
nr:sperm-associated antigen 5 isoform X2 [Anser cygnoides]